MAFDFSKYETPYEVRRARLIDSLIPEGRGRAVVDVGSGPGFFSRMLWKKGWSVTSVDTDLSNLEKAKAFASRTIHADAIGALSGLPADSYDFVITLELIEHMPRVDGEVLLKEIFRALKPGGRLLLSTPNRFSLEGLYGYWLSERILRHGKWQAWDPTHVHIYNAFEIIGLLRGCGFTVSSVTGYYYLISRIPYINRFQSLMHRANFFPLNRLGFNTILSCVKP